MTLSISYNRFPHRLLVRRNAERLPTATLSSGETPKKTITRQAVVLLKTTAKLGL